MTFQIDNFARQMKVGRAIKGWNQQELADASGLSADSIKRYEIGMNVPTLGNAFAIAEALGLSLDAMCALPSPSERAEAKA